LTNPIAVPGGGPAMRGGAPRLDSAQGKNVSCAQIAGFAKSGLVGAVRDTHGPLPPFALSPQGCDAAVRPDIRCNRKIW